MRARDLPLRLALACAVLAPAACGDEQSLRWRIGFTSTALGARAALVEARILKDGCDGAEVLYVSDFAPDESGAAPPPLEEGRYGLLARAQDADCLWYAQGCSEVTLPRAGAEVMVMIAKLASETLDCDGCSAMQCGGRSDAGPDAAPPPGEPDAAIGDDDAGRAPADDDAGIEPPPDAAPPPEPVLVSLEAELADEVQAPLLIVQDDLASGGAYISYPWDMNLTTQENQALKRAMSPAADATDGIAVLPFELPRTASYRLWGRVITPSLDEDSFWIRIDDGEWLQWNDISHQDQTWHWDDVRPFEMRADRFIFTLDRGRHVLRVSYRELGAKLDRVLITSELDFVPTE